MEVFFHTGHHRATQELASEFTRQLDRQLSALSLLSAERLLEGIRAYRTQGRQPNPKATRRARDTFMDKVVDDLRRVHQLSREDARQDG
ncbi:polymorphic toxin type 15 domain-containing protein [Actinomyces wuliandei]|uniref:polymorphic toxin type 15 domain-containing protein n=1 Tax=Actinomyces wuliandei TaxID=2057743 RepID=UPI0015D592FA|nr:polymorphic toxin type 15 domain-containing protein [Actinomyces wuliandei]